MEKLLERLMADPKIKKEAEEEGEGGEEARRRARDVLPLRRKSK